jgi:hypothetical protein
MFVNSVLLGPPSRFELIGPTFPEVVPRHLACLVLPTISAMKRFPFLICMAHPSVSLLPMRLLPCLPTVMIKLPFCASHTALLWFVLWCCRGSSPTPGCFLPFRPPPLLLLFALDLPCRLAAVADALSGMIIADLLLLPPFDDHTKSPLILNIGFCRNTNVHYCTSSYLCAE